VKALKKILVTCIVLVVLMAGGLFAVAKFAPMDKVQARIADVVKEKTGRDLTFTSANVMFWPNIGVRLQNVAFSNAGWAKEKNMATLGALDVNLALRPLLSKRVEVKRFVLQEPVINLEVSADGKRNWEFPKSAKEGEDKAGDDTAKSQNSLTAGGSFKMDEFEIRKGRLSYVDQKSKASHALDNINITISFPDLESAFQMDGALSYLEKRVQLVVSLQKPMVLAEGGASQGELLLKSDDLEAKVAGTFATSGTMLKGGTIDANVPSLPSLVSWLTGKPAADLPFQKVAFKSQATASAAGLDLKNASLKLDDIDASGDVGLDVSGTRPSIFGRLALGKLELDRFIGTAVDKKESSAGTASSAVPEQDWDATPIDFSGLKAVDADLVLKTQGFSLKGADVGPSTLTAVLKNGLLKASSSEASLFDGVFSSTLMLDTTGAPKQAFTFDMKGVQALPVLKTFAGFEKLSGAATADVSVTSSGNSQKSIIGNLNGQGAVTFKNGSITGIDAVNIAQMIQRGLQDAGVGEGKTEFVEMGGTFTITKGVAHNNDLKMRGPLVQVTGIGDVDLPKKYVKYRINPVLTASSGMDDAKGIKVPVNISGPFSNVRIKPDLGAALKDVLKDPAALKEQGKIIEDNFKEIKKDPGKAIENLLGGGGLFGKKPAPAPAPVETAPDAPAPVNDSTLAPPPATEETTAP
jgi:AsmA protein